MIDLTASDKSFALFNDKKITLNESLNIFPKNNNTGTLIRYYNGEITSFTKLINDMPHGRNISAVIIVAFGIYPWQKNFMLKGKIYGECFSLLKK